MSDWLASMAIATHIPPRELMRTPRPVLRAMFEQLKKRGKQGGRDIRFQAREP